MNWKTDMRFALVLATVLCLCGGLPDMVHAAEGGGGGGGGRAGETPAGMRGGGGTGVGVGVVPGGASPSAPGGISGGMPVAPIAPNLSTNLAVPGTTQPLGSPGTQPGGAATPGSGTTIR